MGDAEGGATSTDELRQRVAHLVGEADAGVLSRVAQLLESEAREPAAKRARRLTEDSGAIKLRVHDSSGRCLCVLDVPPSCKVEAVKETIQGTVALPGDSWRLLYGTEELANPQELGSALGTGTAQLTVIESSATRVHVRGVSGSHLCTMDVPQSWKVDDVKESIRSTVTLRSDSCRLLHGAQELPDAQELASAIRMDGKPPSSSNTVELTLVEVAPSHLYVLGGNDEGRYLDSFERLDPATDTWTSMTPLGAPTRLLAATACGGQLFILGGITGDLEAQDSAARFDPRRGQWVPLPSMASKRYSHAATACKGCIYALGGCSSDFVLASVERFDPRVNRWEQMSPMCTPRAGLAAAALGSHVYALGGMNLSLQWQWTVLSSVERLELPSGEWQQLPPMLAQRGNLAGVALQGRVYAIGGNNRLDGLLQSAEAFDPALRAWAQVSPLSVARAKLSAAVCCGRIYAFGGAEDVSPCPVEVFDPESGAWSPIGGMPAPTRKGCAAVAC